ncbi:MAG: SDR family NAD(P)-dependent oxidoreductase, partial [Candidatus Helarchaeota archaeon]
MKYSKALVTGGAGFIGSHTVDALIKTGIEVKVIDDLSAGLKENLNHIENEIEFIQGDVSNYKLVKDSISDVDVIYHLAANASVPTSVENPTLDYMSNATGTFNVLKASIESDVKKIIYASSAAIFGEPKYLPIDEEHPKIPISPYGASKLAGEIYCFAFRETYGLEFTALRIFNCIGPRQPRYVIYDFLKKLRKDKSRLEILGTGKNIRDFIYVGDVVNVFIKCAEQSISNGKAYNLGTGSSISITELAQKILENLKLKNTKLEYTGFSWKGDILKLISDPSKLKKDLGIGKFTPLSEALTDEINWFSQKIGDVLH